MAAWRLRMSAAEALSFTPWGWGPHDEAAPASCIREAGAGRSVIRDEVLKND